MKHGNVWITIIINITIYTFIRRPIGYQPILSF